MNKQEITTLVNKLVLEGKIQEALEYLSAYVSGKDRYLENHLLLQTASFNRQHRDFINKLISKAEYDTVLARVNYAITQILPMLPDSGNTVGQQANSGVFKSSGKKILFLSANPKDKVNLRLGEELRRIKDTLLAATGRDQFTLESEPAVQIPTITHAMQRQDPQIVHFSGHGSGEAGILVEDAIGNAVYFPTSGLNRLFKLFENVVKCVVLNACYSMEQAKVISSHGIYVVGMNDAIGDQAAIDFAVGFYQSLGEGKNYEFAFEIAQVANSANIHDADKPELWLNGEKLEI